MGGRLPKGWDYRELGDLVQITSGGTPSRGNADYWTGMTPWITAKDLKTFNLVDSQDRLSNAGVEHASLVPENTVLVLVRGMGLFKDVPVGVTTRPMAFNQDIKALRPKEGVSARFLGYALQAQRHYLMGNVDQAGHGTGRLSTEVLEEIPIPVPRLEEQLRIVEALDAMDSVVSQGQRLLSLCETSYRVCLLEYLRPVDKKRATGWRRVHLGEVFKERDERSANLPLLAITGEHGVVPRDELIRRDTSAEDKSTYKVILKGDIGYNTMRMWQGVFGLSQYKGIVSPAYTVVAPVASCILGQFASHLFRHPRVIQTFHRYSQGLVDDTLMLKYPHFSEIRLPIPDLVEQRRISMALDMQVNKIEQCRRLLELRKQQKLGLIRSLLSGKWRLDRGRSRAGSDHVRV